MSGGSLDGNAVRDLGRRRRRGGKQQAQKRQHGRAEVGRDIPTREEIKAIVEAAAGRWRPLLITAIFTGLRASELRGLRWSDVDFESRALHFRQRADRYNVIGKRKSKAGWRSAPMTPIVVNTLKEWKLSCPKRDTGKKDADGNAVKELYLVFPNGAGNVESLANIINRGLNPVQVAAGVGIDTGKADEEAGRSSKRNTPACIRSGTGMRPGASTGNRTAGWNCRRRRFRSG